jgi:thioredoxin 1
MTTHTSNKPGFAELIQSSTPVLVDFHAEWCGPCKAMNPLIREVARLVEGKAKVIKVDIDQSQAAAMQFGVQAVPTFIIFKNGKQVWRHSGMIDKQSILSQLEANY